MATCLWTTSRESTMIPLLYMLR